MMQSEGAVAESIDYRSVSAAERDVVRGSRRTVAIQDTMPTDSTYSGWERLDPFSAEANMRQQKARDMLVECCVCPRECGTARLEGQIGRCGAADELLVASWNLHRGEEPPISGSRGSGTIFLTGCSLSCIYCQNYPISQMGVGERVTVPSMVAIMLDLEDQGAHNINYVTPTHYTPSLIEAVIKARQQGLSVPIVWNTSGYERVDTLKLLDGLVDVYLADMRYGIGESGRRFSDVEDYPAVNRAAILEMHRQVGTLELDPNGVAARGLLIRHLVLPGGVSGSDKIFRFLADEVSPETHVSLMSQYFPAHQAEHHPLLGRRLTADEYQRALDAFEASGLTEGYHQGL
jgi:putative pyruvate formate lyase activating enzyme